MSAQAQEPDLPSMQWMQQQLQLVRRLLNLRVRSHDGLADIRLARAMQLASQEAPGNEAQSAWIDSLWQQELHAPVVAAFFCTVEVPALGAQLTFFASHAGC